MLTVSDCGEHRNSCIESPVTRLAGCHHASGISGEPCWYLRLSELFPCSWHAKHCHLSLLLKWVLWFKTIYQLKGFRMFFSRGKLQVTHSASLPPPKLPHESILRSNKSPDVIFHSNISFQEKTIRGRLWKLAIYCNTASSVIRKFDSRPSSCAVCSVCSFKIPCVPKWNAREEGGFLSGPPVTSHAPFPVQGVLQLGMEEGSSRDCDVALLHLSRPRSPVSLLHPSPDILPVGTWRITFLCIHDQAWHSFREE